jgi:hypothetical protein
LPLLVLEPERVFKEEVRAAVLCAQVFDSKWLFVGVIARGWQFWLWGGARTVLP